MRELILDDNKLASLPSLTRMPKLRRLSAENNQLRELREICGCAELREVSLEGNKLTRPALDMKALRNLEILRLSIIPWSTYRRCTMRTSCGR